MTESSTPESGTTTTSTRSRTSVAAKPAATEAQTSLPQGPVEVPHTPTLPMGTVSNFAEPVTAIPPGTPIKVAADPTVTQAEPAAAPVVTTAPPQMEIAAPAPLPRPGDEQLIRGTAEGAAQQEELTGVKPEMPLDPTSPEAQDADRKIFEQQLAQDQEAAEAVAARQQASQERLVAAQQEQQKQQEQQSA